MPNVNCSPEIEIAIRIGVAIAHRNLDVLHTLDLSESRINDLKTVWHRIELAFPPEDRVWFKEVLRGEVSERRSPISLEKLKPTIILIRVSELVGFNLEIIGEMYRQTDGTSAVAINNLPLYIDAARQQRQASVQAAFSCACL